MKRAIYKECPLFDRKCLDAPHFIYGAEMEAEDILWRDAPVTIDELVPPEYEELPEEEKPDRPYTNTIPMGERNNTLSRFAARILIRFGDTDYAKDAFLRQADKCEVALPEKELKTSWRSALKFYKNKVVTSEGYILPDPYNSEFSKVGDLKPGDYSDIGEAKVLAREYGNELVYTGPTDYMRYDGKVWVESKQRAVGAMEEFLDIQLADALTLCSVTKRKLVQAGVPEEMIEFMTKKDLRTLSPEQFAAYLEYEDARKYQGFVMKRRDMKYVVSTLQAAKPMLEIDIADVDADPYLLNTPAGTLDLREGISSLREHQPKDYITKITSVSPSEDGSADWSDQLEKTFLGNRQTLYSTMKLLKKSV